LLLGDAGSGDAAQQAVAQNAATTCANLGCDAVLYLGDNFYPSGVTGPDDPQWASTFDAPYAAMTQPFWAVLGNHDYGGKGIGYDKERAAAQVAVGRRGGKFVMPDRFYARSLRHVDVFALDTPAIVHGDDADQRAAVRAWLASSKGRWRVVVGHHPYWSSGLHGDAGIYDNQQAPPERVGTAWKAFFDEELCGKIDVYISGHDHDLEWLKGPCKMELVISGGGGVAARPVPGERHPSRYKKAAQGVFWIDFDDGVAAGKVIERDAPPADVYRWRKWPI
jgi:hypothetical protein